jgi:hypothetical protein
VQKKNRNPSRPFHSILPGETRNKTERGGKEEGKRSAAFKSEVGSLEPFEAFQQQQRAKVPS